MTHLFSLSDNPLVYRITVTFPGKLSDRLVKFDMIYEWLAETLRGRYHIDYAELPIVIYSFSSETDAVEFKMRFG